MIEAKTIQQINCLKCGVKIDQSTVGYGAMYCVRCNDEVLEELNRFLQTFAWFKGEEIQR